MTSGVRGGADLMVQVVLRLESQEWDLMPAGARERSLRLVSSEYWWIWAVRPCLAAMVVAVFVVYCVVYIMCSYNCFLCSSNANDMTLLIPGVQLSAKLYL